VRVLKVRVFARSRRGAASPDQRDAAALTLAERVADRIQWSRRLVDPDLGLVWGRLAP
jgi:hypothetical protein